MRRRRSAIWVSRSDSRPADFGTAPVPTLERGGPSRRILSSRASWAGASRKRSPPTSCPSSPSFASPLVGGALSLGGDEEEDDKWDDKCDDEKTGPPSRRAGGETSSRRSEAFPWRSSGRSSDPTTGFPLGVGEAPPVSSSVGSSGVGLKDALEDALEDAARRTTGRPEYFPDASSFFNFSVFPFSHSSRSCLKASRLKASHLASSLSTYFGVGNNRKSSSSRSFCLRAAQLRMAVWGYRKGGHEYTVPGGSLRRPLGTLCAMIGNGKGKPTPK